MGRVGESSEHGRPRARASVYRGGGGEHHPHPLPLARGLEDVLGGQDVVLHVPAIARTPAGAHAGLGRQVEDDVGLLDELPQVPAAEVDRHELEARPLAHMPEVGELLRAPVVVVEAIDAHDRVPAVEQGLCEVRADEARTTGHKRAHAHRNARQGARGACEEHVITSLPTRASPNNHTPSRGGARGCLRHTAIRHDKDVDEDVGFPNHIAGDGPGERPAAHGARAARPASRPQRCSPRNLPHPAPQRRSPRDSPRPARGAESFRPRILPAPAAIRADRGCHHRALHLRRLAGLGLLPLHARGTGRAPLSNAQVPQDAPHRAGRPIDDRRRTSASPRSAAFCR